MTRTELFVAPRPPEFWAILDEAVIRRPILPPKEMAEQLEHIVEAVRRTRSILQIVPWSSPAHPFMTGMTKIMTFSDSPPVVYTESLHNGQLIDDPSLVKQYRRSYDLLRAAALSPKASLALIEAAAEDYRNDQQQD